MIGPHLSISALTCARSDSGCALSDDAGSAPNWANRALSLSSFNASWRVALNLSITGLGVPLGAYRPYKMFSSNPGKPALSRVGVSGTEGQLSDPILARDAVNLDLVGFDV